MKYQTELPNIIYFCLLFFLANNDCATATAAQIIALAQSYSVYSPAHITVHVEKYAGN